VNASCLSKRHFRARVRACGNLQIDHACPVSVSDAWPRARLPTVHRQLEVEVRVVGPIQGMGLKIDLEYKGRRAGARTRVRP